MEIDIHTHTIASGHAYSTLDEMAAAASIRGLKAMAMTDHGPEMPGGAHLYHFYNLRIIPEYIHGVRILKGAEVNIIDYKGKLDIPDNILKEMDLVIASFHNPCIEPSDTKNTTEALLSLMDNPLVHIIGHPEDKRYSFDIKSIVSMAKSTRTLLEVNNSSLLPTTFREGSREGIIKILTECAREEVKVVLGSDAHHTSSVGEFGKAMEIIKEINFPEELIINKSSEDFFNYIKR